MQDKTLINLDDYKNKSDSTLNEASRGELIRFGAQIKQMLYYMFAEPGQSFGSFYVTGQQNDVKAFAAALGAEKKYMESYLKNGLNDPQVLNNRYRLETAVQNFEKQTGIKWPFK
jgi:hypothetical protein